MIQELRPAVLVQNAETQDEEEVMVENQICAWLQLSKQFAYHVAFNCTKGLDTVKSKHTLNCVAADMCVGQVGEGEVKIVGALCSMKVEVNQRLKGDIKA